jgi:hypothetical protein
MNVPLSSATYIVEGVFDYMVDNEKYLGLGLLLALFVPVLVDDNHLTLVQYLYPH